MCNFNQEIAPGILILSTIVSSKTPIIRVMNTTSEVQVISKNVELKTEQLSDYSVQNLETCNKKSKRTKNFSRYSSKKLLPWRKRNYSNYARNFRTYSLLIQIQ